MTRLGGTCSENEAGKKPAKIQSGATRALLNEASSYTTAMSPQLGIGLVVKK